MTANAILGDMTYKRLIRRNHVFPFHCNRFCDGLQVWNSGTGRTALTELYIHVECPQTAGLSQGYCVF